MLADLLEEIETILQEKGLLKLPEFNRVLRKTKRYQRYRELVSSDSMSYNGKTSDELEVEPVFRLLDIFIDTKYPNLGGQTFSRKYQNLPSSTCREIILKELYRIMKLIRNAVVHPHSSLYISDNTINISYNYKNTNFQLATGKLNLVYTLSVLLVKYVGCEAKYIDGFLCGYYNEIFSNIRISDENGSSLHSLPLQCSAFTKRIRNIVLDPEIYFRNNHIRITFFDLPEQETAYSTCDYLVSLNGQYYIVPEEILSQLNGLISRESLKDWELKECLEDFIKLNDC